MIFVPLLILVSSGVTSLAQRIEYLNGIQENQSCRYDNSRNGICVKVSECLHEFERFKKNQSVLKVCQYKNNPANSVVCCPRNIEKKLDLTNFEVCRAQFLEFRKNGTSVAPLAMAYFNKKVPNTLENCMKIAKLSIKENADGKFWDTVTYPCNVHKDGTFGLVAVSPFYGQLVKRGDRPNMAAIGINFRNSTKFYFCGGSIITTRFIVTAAHCKFYKKQMPNIIRVGDRFLLTEEDDDIAQQLTITKFIIHEEYSSRYAYNDIALIKTVESIIFNNFVVPSCIADLNAERRGNDIDWTVAGYGQTEDQVQSNVLLELYVDMVNNTECNKIYSGYDNLPNGILDSQICVKSQPDRRNEKGEYPDTCFGDSGSPLQYKTAYEVFPADFNTTFISHMYLSSNVIGIVSFGISCGLDAPSVYTKLSYYRNWMRTTIENNQ